MFILFSSPRSRSHPLLSGWHPAYPACWLFVLLRAHFSSRTSLVFWTCFCHFFFWSCFFVVAIAQPPSTHFVFVCVCYICVTLSLFFWSPSVLPGKADLTWCRPDSASAGMKSHTENQPQLVAVVVVVFCLMFTLKCVCTCLSAFCCPGGEICALFASFFLQFLLDGGFFISTFSVCFCTVEHNSCWRRFLAVFSSEKLRQRWARRFWNF